MDEGVSRVRASGEDRGRSRGGQDVTHGVPSLMILPAITLWREFFRPFAEEKGNGFAKRQLFRRLKVRRNIWTIHPAEQQPPAALQVFGGRVRAMPAEAVPLLTPGKCRATL